MFSDVRKVAETSRLSLLPQNQRRDASAMEAAHPAPGAYVEKWMDLLTRIPKTPAVLSDFGLRSENSIRLKQDFVGFAKHSTAI